MKMRLQYKVPILILLVMLFIGVATGAIMIYLQRQAGEDEFKQTATGLAGAVQGSLEEYMLEPGIEHGLAIGPAVSGLVKEELVNDVVIYQVDGSILASGSGQSTGEGTMDEAIQNVLSSGEALTELRSGRTELSVVTPIRNRIECRESCHGADGDVLGAVQVTLDTATLADREAQQVMIMLLVGTVTFLLVGGAATYVVRSTVLNPLASLGVSADRISDGDYTARAQVPSRDELGRLARTFNAMAGRVQSRTQEIEQLNAELEDRVYQRTRELSALNTVIGVANRSLNLDTILGDTLEKVLSLVGMDAGVVHLHGDNVSPPRGFSRGIPSEYEHQVGGEGLEECFVGRRLLSGAWVTGSDAIGSGGACVLESEGFKSHVSVPVESGGKVLGALCLFSREKRDLDTRTIGLIETIGRAIGGPVENAQVAEKLEQANKKLNTLMEQAMKGGFDVRYENPRLTDCWVEKECGDTGCPCYAVEYVRCWQVVGTFCGGDIQCRFCEGLGSCTECDVYQKGCWQDAITAIGENFNNMMFLLGREAEHREQVREQLIERIIAAQEDERKRVARELHDETGQALTAAMMEVAKTVDSLPPEMEEARMGMASARAVISDALANLRKLIFDLRPEVLDDLGLVPALRSYVRNRLRTGSIEVTFRYGGGKRRLPPQVELLLFRVVQEAVTNILRHAEASAAEVYLNVEETAAIVTIRDDGKGFDVEYALQSAESWGLRGMQERVTLLGGRLHIESQSDKGTMVRVEIPLEVASVG